MEAAVSNHPLVRVLVSRLRNRETSPASFRRAVAEATRLLLYEALDDLPLTSEQIETPLTTTSGERLAHRVVFVPILRAGLGMSSAAERILPHATVCHLGLERDEDTLEPRVYYRRVPEDGLAGVHTVLLDPMLATGGTASAAVDVVKSAGADDIRFVGLIGAPEGASDLHDAHPDVQIRLGALDARLTDASDPFPSGFILPGLGDAGDRQFGTG